MKHARLRNISKHREVRVNDAESRFRAMAARGSAKKGLALVDKLDAAFAKKP